MGFFGKIGEEINFLKLMNAMQNTIKDLDFDSSRTIADDFEDICDKYNSKTAFIFEGKSMTYGQFDNMANRYANWAVSMGITAGQVVALFMPNRPEYVACWYGLSKVGVVSALINTGLVGTALAHCVKIANAKAIIVDESLQNEWSEVSPQMPDVTSFLRGGNGGIFNDLDRGLNAQSNRRPNIIHRSGITGIDPCLYIYTSGTTGHPKAAIITQGRVQGISRVFIAGTGANSQDVVYIPLPLYHSTGGIAGIGIALNTGATIVLKSKFSASQFWDDIIKSKSTIFVYIGEMFRYLLANEPSEDETKHALKSCFGNGLRPDVWERADDRFKIPKIVEFYGSTEGTVFLVNVTGKMGAVGRVPKYLKKKIKIELVKFDIETELPVRGEDGLCIKCEFDEVGEIIGLLTEGDARATFSGYAGDTEATNKKVLRNVFEQGDAYFRTGDLMRQDKDGYFYFVDRVGDTYRWKSENVSTTDVGEALSTFEGIEQANAYGVEIPNVDGRAGMAVIVAPEEVNFDNLLAHLKRELPSFAIPIFLRIQKEIEVTQTFKYKKVDLVKEGFNPKNIEDKIFWLDPKIGKYCQLDDEGFEAIMANKIRF